MIAAEDSSSAERCGESGVAWVVPQYDREAVNAAAAVYMAVSDQPLIYSGDYFEYLDALRVINNWRSSHSYPLNTFQVTLRSYARKVDSAPLIAQRIKRLSSIEAKLRRLPRMKLTQMQDIGGCRAVVTSIDQVQALAALYGTSNIKHVRASCDDYIEKPQQSGYRGIHLVYRYFSDKQKMAYNDLKVEIQLRSQYQHAWATAVETVGTFVKQALKSSIGEPDWLRFFSLMGSVIALRETSPLVPSTPETLAKLRDELRHYANKLNLVARLRTYGDALRTLGTEQPGLENSHFYLLELDPEENTLTVMGFKANEAEHASDMYLKAEERVKMNPITDAVLVSVDSLTALQRAYPNYFLDTRVFLQLVTQTLGKRRGPISVEPRGIG